MKYSIVIPAHNEYKSLQILIPELIKVIKDNHRFGQSELILIDDGSTDKTKKVIKTYAQKHSFIKPIYLNKRFGQAGCFKAGFAQASGDYIIRMDADLQDNPQDLKLFYQSFKEGADLVVGLRECRQHRRIYRLTTYIYDFLVVLFFNSPLHASSGSFIGFKAYLVKKIPFVNNDHRYLPLIAIKRGAKNIREVIVRHQSRRYGHSKYHPVKKLFFGFFEIWRFFWRLKIGYYDID